MAKIYHPDSLNLPIEEANEKMQILNWAYEQAQAVGVET